MFRFCNSLNLQLPYPLSQLIMSFSRYQIPIAYVIPSYTILSINYKVDMSDLRENPSK